MTKSISSQLLADLQKTVTTTAVCVDIVRRDGKTIRLTNHDSDLVVDGHTYNHSIPFVLGAVDSGSQMSTDNVALTLFADGTVFDLDAFDAGLYDSAECSIFTVDYENTSHGKMTLRRGWFGPIDRNQNRVITVTVTGLLKVLDFEVGRIYQPTCDADFGDRRCKVAVNISQAYSERNLYRAGDWVYYMDTALLTAITLVNPGFEVDGVRAANQPITGWTRAAGSGITVKADTPAPVLGSFALYGDTDSTPNDSGFVDYVYQDINLVTAGLNTAAIDDGQLSLFYQAALAHNVYTLDPLNLKIEQFDANGELITATELGWQFLDTFNVWRDRFLFTPLRPGARSVRIYLMMRKEDGAITNCAFDDVRLYYWNHTTTNPYSNVIHKASRIIGLSDGELTVPKNASFEVNGLVANGLSPTITNWVTTGSYWQVVGNVGGISAQHGSRVLAGGDDGGAVQQTWTIYQDCTVASLTSLSSARILLGKVVGRFACSTFFGDAGLTNATVKISFYNSIGTLLNEYKPLDNTSPGAPGIVTATQGFMLPPETATIRITLQVHTPVGSGNGSQVGFDNIRFHFYDADRPVSSDPISVTASGVPLDTTAGNYSVDGNVVWYASGAHITWDLVSSVVSNKEFVATTMVGSSGTFETGYVWWLSGANAGLKSPIRTFTSATSKVKLYFREPLSITPGDRFLVVRTCQRRFVEDCVGTFFNGINFRGFPHLPGKLTSEAEAAESG